MGEPTESGSPGLTPLRVERLAPANGPPASPAPPPAGSAVPASPGPGAPAIEAEIVALRFLLAAADDPSVQKRVLHGSPLALVTPPRPGTQERALLRFPRPAWLDRRSERVTFPARGPDPFQGLPGSVGEGRPDLEVLLVAPGRPLAFGETAPPPADWEAWVRSGTSEPGLRVHLGTGFAQAAPVAASAAPGGAPRYLESAEVLLLAGKRAVLVAPPATREGWLLAVAAFAFLEGELVRLERETAVVYALEAGKITERLATPAAEERDREPEHLAYVARLQRVRRELALLEPVLDEAPRDLAPAARAVFGLLGEHGAVAARLAALDDRLEVLEDQGEVVGERLLELGISRRGERVEWLIVWILVLEVLVMGVEAYLALKSYKLEAKNATASGTSGSEKG